MGADPDELEKVARCIIQVRRLARWWCVPRFADGRDYLATLYLTVLSLLPYTGRGHSGVANERWVVELCWVLEAALDRLLGREPFDREQLSYNPVHTISAGFVRDADAPRRVHDLCATPDGREAIQPVAALHGVLQGSYHHLDAYRHTLSVLAYMEALLAEPIRGLLDPAALDGSVASKFKEYGLDVPPPAQAQANPPAVDPPWFEAHQGRVREWLTTVLNPESILLLKWCALLHDVGKSGTRTMKEKSGTREVQFIGHERYGVALLQSRLAAWFPGDHPDERPVSPAGLRLAELIRNHHRSHQLIGDNLLRDPDRAAALYTLAGGVPRPEMRKWLRDHSEEGRRDFRPDLPVLLLHGYADRLAARGPKTGAVSDWAAVTLALLTCLAREGELTAEDTRRAAAGANATAAAREYAAELLAGGHIQAQQVDRAIGLLRKTCADRPEAGDGLARYLRDTVSVEELARLLGGTGGGAAMV